MRGCNQTPKLYREDDLKMNKSNGGLKGHEGLGCLGRAGRVPCYKLGESLEVNETKLTQCVAGVEV